MRLGAMENFIAGLPKAELHLHIEGTLEPELMLTLAKRNKIKLPFHSIEEIYQAYQFQDLVSFLKIYYQTANVLIQEQDFYDLTFTFLQKAKKQNIRHIEIFFDPQTHTKRGIRFDTVIQGLRRALIDGQKQLGISSHIIMCFLRDLSVDSAAETLQCALPFKDWIIAVGLDSAERGQPPRKFTKIFSEARKYGFLTVAHAGEEGPPEYIWEALEELKVKRIDHGVRCLEDPLLVRALIKREIPLTVCPLSNVKLHVFKTIAQLPIKKMFDKGLRVTINSDDPAFFNGYINENFSAVADAFNFSKQDLYQLAKNSFLASFISDIERKQFINELDNYFTLFQ